MIGIGPFSIQTVIVIAAVVVAWMVARLLAMRLAGASHKTAGGLVVDSVFWGLLAARLGYIIQWWADYRVKPISMIAIGDGGYSWWVGVLVAVGFVWWRTRSIPALHRAVQGGVLAGVLVWAAAGSVVAQLNRSVPLLPDLQLATPDGRTVSLNSYAGRPMVLNLWASWCPPCRREMPVFEQAQAEFSDIAFVMINQGESAQQAKRFLEREQLSLSQVLLDPASQAMQAMNSRGLPTTLFFDAQGRLVDSHMGEITMPSLKDKISRHFN